ncbi:hypothetical protein SODALDRAFT_322280 [Sodiomyces alkalinus F11]|uniref:Uncharacterized protein n=1 Tax=Sodiomyces alkalinus (strain CBS 110278 / VKM F-3762 / F11) TaxID=1314773 RepID=A0A3N2Q2V9_SODAK|nr:hypothetical protein SODALDRAFT_322280 [Sodiomyces alkalinus F11]ROT41072.1 hypothetical protein SODALDRAFT_322280 [Sodiomyces alkalinus F11]
MQLTVIFLTATAALSVAASSDLDQKILNEKIECPGNSSWDKIEKMCKCGRGEDFDIRANRCLRAEAKVDGVPKCRANERLYCVRGKDDYVQFDHNDPFCSQMEDRKIFCARENNPSQVFPSGVRPGQESDQLNIPQGNNIAEESNTLKEDTGRPERGRGSCDDPRRWNDCKRQCQCRLGMDRDAAMNDCYCRRYFTEPSCPAGKKPFCVRGRFEWARCRKDDMPIRCINTGKNYVFCCQFRKEAGVRERVIDIRRCVIALKHYEERRKGAR